MAMLEATCGRLGLGPRLRLIGRVPHDVLPTWMNVFDVGLSTQTDDPVGWGRTTAKLPEYLACGTAVMCSDVGEAHRWLASNGQTLAYHGLCDPTYPTRLAERLRRCATRTWNRFGEITGPWHCGCSIIASSAGTSVSFSIRREASSHAAGPMNRTGLGRGWAALLLMMLGYAILFAVYYPPLSGIEDEVGYVNRASSGRAGS